MAFESVAAFVNALRQHGLLAPEQLAEVSRLQDHYADAKSLAKDLMQRNWLTPFQINQLFMGKGQDLVLGPYLLMERLGEGGMGQVFKARHKNMDRVVALKIIRKERLTHKGAVRRFRREMRAAAQLTHPNVVHAFDADAINDLHFYAMEYVEGVDLGKLIKERGPLPVVQACDYIRQAAQGLQHAFEHGLVHRDIKPSNLLLAVSKVPATAVAAADAGKSGSASGLPSGLAQGPTIKILDLGLARVNDPGEESESLLTIQGSVIGTIDYIAPEQALDSHNVDIRADLYALGCTFYFLLTGRVPFAGGTFTEKLLKHRLEDPVPVERLRPEISPSIGAVVRKLLAKKPADRFQTPAELAAVLAQVDSQGVLPQGTLKSAAFQPTVLLPASRTTSTPGMAGGTRETSSGWSSIVNSPTAELGPASARNLRTQQRMDWRKLLVGAVAFLLMWLLLLTVYFVWRGRSKPPKSPAQKGPSQVQVGLWDGQPALDGAHRGR